MWPHEFEMLWHLGEEPMTAGELATVLNASRPQHAHRSPRTVGTSSSEEGERAVVPPWLLGAGAAALEPGVWLAPNEAGTGRHDEVAHAVLHAALGSLRERLTSDETVEVAARTYCAYRFSATRKAGPAARQWDDATDEERARWLGQMHRVLAAVADHLDNRTEGAR